MLKISALLPILFLFPIISDHKVFKSASAWAQEADLTDKLQLLPQAKIKKIKAGGIFKEAYEIRLSQPVDHNRPNGAQFKQRIYLSHLDMKSPMVLETEGYAANRNYTKELTRLLKSNQIIVEHRYFGASKPNPLDWSYLTVKQAAADHHRIIQLFKKIYKGKWLSTGISKGGQTALFHRRYYPKDVDAVFAYVAPINRMLEDKRIDNFFDQVGDPDTRARIKNFQRRLLKNRDKLIPLLKKSKYKFSIGYDLAFEYGVLEYLFSYWQWFSDKKSHIPSENVSIEEMYKHFSDVVSFYYYSDRGIDYIKTFFYQSSTELGNYAYLTGHLKDLLQTKHRHCNGFFAPKGVRCLFQPHVMADIQNWLINRGDRIIHLHGALDPWSASSIQPSEKIDAFRILKEGACHGVRIKDLSTEEKRRIYNALERWMDVKIQDSGLEKTVYDWENPTIIHKNKEQGHASCIPLGPHSCSIQSSPYYLCLNGTWKFHWSKKPADRPKDFYKQRNQSFPFFY